MAYGAILGQTPPAPEAPHKVGDILTTVRTDLGPNWLLCNGDAIDENEYPELANRISKLPYGIPIEFQVEMPSGSTSTLQNGDSTGVMCIGDNGRVCVIVNAISD